jgi:hypothetical protein
MKDIKEHRMKRVSHVNEKKEKKKVKLVFKRLNQLQAFALK